MNSHFVILMFLVASTVADTDEQATFQESITTALITATQDADSEVRFAAYSALKELPKSDAAVEAFRRGLEDNSTDVRALALSKLVDYVGPTDEVLSRLMRALDEDEVSPTAANLLIRMGEPAVPRLIDAIENEKPSVKVIAAGILGKVGLGKHRDKAVASVTSMLQDDDPRIRIAAIGTLKSIATAEFGAVDERALRLARQFVARIDSNQDGVLTEEEWNTTSLQDRLPGADRDQDGRVTAEEVARSLRLLRRPARRD